MLVTSLRCWRPIWYIGKITNITKKSHQHNDSATNIWNQSPSKSHQHNDVNNIAVTLFAIEILKIWKQATKSNFSHISGKFNENNNQIKQENRYYCFVAFILTATNCIFLTWKRSWMVDLNMHHFQFLFKGSLSIAFT